MNERYNSKCKIAGILLDIGLDIPLIEVMTSLDKEDILRLKEKKM